jgi:hypothetical protein
MPSLDIERFKRSLHQRLPKDSSGRIGYKARANAVKGGVPDIGHAAAASV